MENICYRMDIAKKMLYEDFANKKELVNTLFLKEFQCFKLDLTLAIDGCKDAVQQLCVLFEFFSKRQNSFGYATLWDLREYYPPLNSEIMDLENQLITETTASIIKQGITELNFREDIVPERIGGIFIFHFMSGIILKRNQIHQNLFSFSDAGLLDFHFRSICTPVGLELWNKNMDCHKTIYE